MQLTGKVAMVTGAAGGIGTVLARGFAEAGAAVVLLDRADARAAAESLTAEGHKALAIVADVTRMSDLTQAVETATQAFGPITILVNNAARYGDLAMTPFERIDEDDWDSCMAVNVKGIWNCCRAVMPGMVDSGGGSIVNIASLAATYGMPYALHYTTSKAAVIGLTRGLARELGRRGVRVNSISPSAVTTQATRNFMGERHDALLGKIRELQCLSDDNLREEDVVNAALYLASDASRMVTGQMLAVDGGSVFT